MKRVMHERDIDNLLEEVVRRLQAAFEPRAIYLYGSRAYGTPTVSSDVDLLVVVNDSPLDFFDRSAAAY